MLPTIENRKTKSCPLHTLLNINSKLPGPPKTQRQESFGFQPCFECIQQLSDFERRRSLNENPQENKQLQDFAE